MTLLTKPAAEQYVQNYFAKLSEPSPCEIIRSVERDDYGIPMIDVRYFHEGHEGTFSVWIEGGKLYGEW